MFFFFQAEDGIRDLVRSRGLGDVYKRQVYNPRPPGVRDAAGLAQGTGRRQRVCRGAEGLALSLIHI